MSALVVGLTGGIGSGKTAVSDVFQSFGIQIVDADVIAREVVAPGQPALQAIVDKMGENILADGQLDRRALREKVFSEPALKDWLNGLLHPLIREQMILQTRSATSPYCVLAIPLLVENQLQHLVDRVLVVDVEEKRQIERASKRDDQSPQQVEQIMQSQASRTQRNAMADDIVDNNGSMETLKQQVLDLHEQYLQLAKNLPKA